MEYSYLYSYFYGNIMVFSYFYQPFIREYYGRLEVQYNFFHQCKRADVSEMGSEIKHFSPRKTDTLWWTNIYSYGKWDLMGFNGIL